MPRRQKKILQKFYSLSFLLLVLLVCMTGVTVLMLQQRYEVKNKIVEAASTEFGFNVAARWRVPTLEQYQMLNPRWIRFGMIIGTPQYPFIPESVKRLMVINNEETTSFPQNSTDFQTWKTYVDTQYVPAIKDLLTKYPHPHAIEVWNEEDLCPNGSCVPARSYAYLLKSAAKTIKSIDKNIIVVMGGLASGNLQYITDVRNAESGVFSQVDAIGIHPYGNSPGGWCAKGCSGGELPFGDLATNIRKVQQVAGMPIWVTEIGANTLDQNWQADYLKRIFTVFQQTGIPVAIWYSDFDGSGEWGLLQRDGKIKESGRAFFSLNKQPTPAGPKTGTSPTGTNRPTSPPSRTSPSPNSPVISLRPTGSISLPPQISSVISPTPTTPVIPTFFCLGLGKGTDCSSHPTHAVSPVPSFLAPANQPAQNPISPAVIGGAILGVIGIAGAILALRK